MRRHPRFTLVYAPEVYEHLQSIESKHYRLIARTIEEQLSHTPMARTRNRKPLEEPSALGATWELRFGPNNLLRAFYEVDPHERVVAILAIGVKEGNRLLIGGQEVTL